MPNFSSLQQFFDSITARLNKPKRGVGGSEGVVNADVLEALKDVGRYADDVKASSEALNSGFVARSLNNVATIYVRGDTGNDTRTGVDDNSTASGAVKTLARAIELHSGKTQKLAIRILSGLVEVTSDLSAIIPDLSISIASGATLRFRNRTNLLDTNNVNVGGGTYRLLCFSNSVAIQNNGYLEILDHAAYTGSGNVFYYNFAQGAISICSNTDAIDGIAFQTIAFANVGNVYIGNYCTLFAYGTHGTNGYGSKLARYNRSDFGGSVTLGTNAKESVLETDKLRETLVFEGNGSAKSFNIRRTYAFQFEMVYNDGCTITVQPAASCLANANNTLTFSGAVGKTVTVRLTSNLSI
ncbi:hypothetical protein [Persicitalea jodogahamensis]|uniref:Uncharacterized protein n=1 Tax=Persicitalea jodogahamensis TaxID=402147 RepID=A0A8J3G959_9BACT|nr:hypothetical protein [Persicitalea jodogahamensis]GHB63954.1 hypothetical protein GCM10007390_17270 [Persicitalea jodogahamensis]